MVYCGRISAACEPCRRKRRKCDFIRPTCTQCTRGSESCTGYRDPSKLRVRNETNKVKTKARNTRREEHSVNEATECFVVAGSLADATISTTAPCQRARLTGHLFKRAPTTPANDLALSYFMTRLVPSTSFHYLGRFWNCLGHENNSTSSTALAMQACSLAFLAQDSDQSDLLVLACSRYTKALKQVNKDIEDPRMRTLDTMIVSVLLLAAFESIVTEDSGPSGPWTSHIQGSTRLIQLRGLAGFETALGKHLLRHVSENVRASCIQRRVPIPSEFGGLQDSATKSALSDIAHGLAGILNKYIHLCSDAGKGSRLEVLQLCLRLNEEIQALLEILMVSAPYSEVDSSAKLLSQDEVTYAGPEHRYPSPLDARRWNKVRVVSLFVNELTLSTVRQIEDDHLPDTDRKGIRFFGIGLKAIYKATTARSKATISDILAAASFSTKHDFDMLSVRPLIWPLFAAGASSSAPEYARLAAMCMLENIGRTHRHVKAQEAADLLKANVGLHDWARGPADCAFFVSI